ncbi:SDR family oxidoreductase [Neokomagataea thailandica]|uniref:NADH-ubiquinone oxidoreductase 39-40 kDa subunit n=1 Tax=Neokomagataea tanensis NBRC 106556 TaxID=1223519 RepID=A0ABQ0QIV0_9PROT|nr:MULTISPECIES: NAD-dependent epimerase/dehydratase family protein [Neokomagataea]GBR46392.1 NADH-ubiquinone oxidoreductase 39-40 kDa subunit [Neokomagataea tanensis NBRC 106556]
MTRLIAVIGANGRSGRSLCSALIAQGYNVRAILRRIETLPNDLRPHLHSVMQADLTNQDTLNTALQDVTLVANTAHARHIPAILQASSAPIIALGSTRKFTRWPDAHGNGVLAGEAALHQDGRPSLLLHPTMIYGANGENNVQRLAKLIRKLPIIPLPGGGTMQVQPIEQRDVIQCLVAGTSLLIHHQITTPETLIIAGKTALPYRQFIQKISHYAGLRQRPIVSVPGALLAHLAWYTRCFSFVPTIKPEEIRRLLEDKIFDITPMQERLNVHPSSLDDGLERLFSSSNEATLKQQNTSAP